MKWWLTNKDSCVKFPDVLLSLFPSFNIERNANCVSSRKVMREWRFVSTLYVVCKDVYLLRNKKKRRNKLVFFFCCSFVEKLHLLVEEIDDFLAQYELQENKVENFHNRQTENMFFNKNINEKSNLPAAFLQLVLEPPTMASSTTTNKNSHLNKISLEYFFGRPSAHECMHNEFRVPYRWRSFFT